MSESASPVGMNVPVLLQQALAHHQAGRLQEAQSLYRAVLQASPQHPDANHNLGVLVLQLNQPAVALGHLKAALDANPAQGQYWLSYIAALMQAGQLDAARQVLGQGRARGLAGPQVEVLVSKLGDGLAAGAGAGPAGAEVEQVVGLFGQGRYAEAEPLARALLDRSPGWQVIALCGQNPGLLSRIEALAANGRRCSSWPGSTPRTAGRSPSPACPTARSACCGVRSPSRRDPAPAGGADASRAVIDVMIDLPATPTCRATGTRPIAW